MFTDESSQLQSFTTRTSFDISEGHGDEHGQGNHCDADVQKEGAIDSRHGGGGSSQQRTDEPAYSLGSAHDREGAAPLFDANGAYEEVEPYETPDRPPDTQHENRQSVSRDRAAQNDADKAPPARTRPLPLPPFVPRIGRSAIRRNRKRKRGGSRQREDRPATDADAPRSWAPKTMNGMTAPSPIAKMTMGT